MRAKFLLSNLTSRYFQSYLRAIDHLIFFETIGSVDRMRSDFFFHFLILYERTFYLNIIIFRNFTRHTNNIRRVNKIAYLLCLEPLKYSHLIRKFMNNSLYALNIPTYCFALAVIHKESFASNCIIS